MKKFPEKILCFHCHTDPAHKISYRWQDPKRRYKNSNVKIIHTGYTFLCIKCIKNLLEQTEGYAY